MKTRLLAGLVGIGLCFAPLASAASSKKKTAMSSDMQRAIAWERHKDAAAARQARLEARHPSVSYENSANRSANRSAEEPAQERPVKDPGPNPKPDKQ